MESKIKEGDTAYLLNGEAVYVRGTIKAGYFVSRLYEVNGENGEPPGEEMEDTITFVKAVYVNPLLPMYHADVRVLTNRAKELEFLLKAQYEQFGKASIALGEMMVAMEKVNELSERVFNELPE